MMSYSIKNKILIWAVVLLLIANIITIVTFWFGRYRPARLRSGQPAEYLIKELGFDEKQKATYMQLVQDHQQRAEKLRQEIKSGKDHFFDLLQQVNVTDTAKKLAAGVISHLTQELDLLTFDHFQKVRNICDTGQQKKFDAVIHDVLNIVGSPGQGGLHGPNGPPPGGQDGLPPGNDGPPPGPGNGQPPPPRP